MTLSAAAKFRIIEVLNTHIYDVSLTSAMNISRDLEMVLNEALADQTSNTGVSVVYHLGVAHDLSIDNSTVSLAWNHAPTMSAIYDNRKIQAIKEFREFLKSQNAKPEYVSLVFCKRIIDKIYNDYYDPKF